MIKIELADNGYILHTENPNYDPKEGNRKYIKEVFSDDMKGLVGLLYEVLELVGPSMSKHSNERIYIKVAPGMDHESYQGLDYDYDAAHE